MFKSDPFSSRVSGLTSSESLIVRRAVHHRSAGTIGNFEAAKLLSATILG
jgi:hypothetical protein